MIPADLQHKPGCWERSRAAELEVQSAAWKLLYVSRAGWGGEAQLCALGTQESVHVGCFWVLRKHLSPNELYWVMSSMGIENHEML